jgi:hypothetical protein
MDVEHYAGEDIMVLDEQSREDTPKKLIAPLSHAGSLAGNGSRGTCSR